MKTNCKKKYLVGTMKHSIDNENFRNSPRMQIGLRGNTEWSKCEGSFYWIFLQNIVDNNNNN